MSRKWLISFSALSQLLIRSVSAGSFSDSLSTLSFNKRVKMLPRLCGWFVPWTRWRRSWEVWQWRLMGRRRLFLACYKLEGRSFIKLEEHTITGHTGRSFFFWLWKILFEECTEQTIHWLPLCRLFMADYSSLATLPLVPGRVFYAPQVRDTSVPQFGWIFGTRRKTPNGLWPFAPTYIHSTFLRWFWAGVQQETLNSWQSSSPPRTQPLIWSLRYCVQAPSKYDSSSRKFVFLLTLH